MGESTDVVAAVCKVSKRRIQQLVKIYKETGEYPVQKVERRLKDVLPMKRSISSRKHTMSRFQVPVCSGTT